MNQLDFRAIICNFLKARENSHVQGSKDFGFACHWLKNWGELFKPITSLSYNNKALPLLSRNMTRERFSNHSEKASSSAQPVDIVL